MSGRAAGRVFISYSRKDGAGFAESLRQSLEQEDLSIWQDIVTLEGGRDWWSQIEEALKSKALQHFVLVVTRGALDSAVVRREIRLARQEGKTVCPVKGPGLDDLSKLPRWLGQVYDLDLPEHRRTLIRVLQDQSRQKRVAMMAPEPPADFVPRPVEFESLKQKLLDAKGDAVAITAALRGAGGYGKTTLAKALAHDADVQDAYFDGILWAELGETPDGLLKTLSDLITLLTGEPPTLETINGAAAKLGETLGDRRILLIIDDVWREQDLRPFLQGGPNATRLVTTRIDSVLPDNAVRQLVDAMQAGEALSLLTGGLPPSEVEAERRGFEKLGQRLGEWAQLLKIVNGFLRDRVINNRQPVADALAGVNKRLDAKGLVAFDPRNEADRTKAVARTIGVSLDLLSDDERARFGELGVFPEDVDVPLGVIERLWNATGALDAFDTEDLLGGLFDLSLLLNLDLGRRTFRLHDTVRQFLLDQAGADGIVAQQRRLNAALEGLEKHDNADALSRQYFYLHLPYHLAQASDREKLDALLLDPSWLKAKLDATESPQALIGDYEQYGHTEVHSLIERTLRLTAGICARDPRQLPVQLASRLLGVREADDFARKAHDVIATPTIFPFRPSLTPPGAETARFEGHEDSVFSLCVLPDGRLASGSHDWTIRIWDVGRGVETARFEGHLDSVVSLCVLPDGRLASGSHDRTIRLWDVGRGVETARFEGHADWVRSLCVMPDGRLASGSDDGTIRLWDVARGVETARFERHEDWVRSLCVMPDGRLASGSDDGTIRLWDVARRVEAVRFEGHMQPVASLCVLPDGRLASGSDDGTIRLWDVARGVEADRFEGHEDGISSLSVLADGRLASGSNDRTIGLWDVARGVETDRFKGHESLVTSLALLPDGRLASGSDDGTIRLWDAARGVETGRFEGHADLVRSLCVLPDGRLASGADDRTIRLWDVARGVETARFEGYRGAVTSLCLLPDSRLASSSSDGTISFWDVVRGVETARIEGHEGGVFSLCVLPDNRLASGSFDGTILIWDVAWRVPTARFKGLGDWAHPFCLLPDGRLAVGSGEGTIHLWDVARGVKAARFEGHEGLGGVWSLCVLPDGRLASGSGEGIIHLWDVARGVETDRFEGHAKSIKSLSVLPDNRLASGSDDRTIRLWDVARGREVCRLEVDASVTAITALSANHLVVGDALGRLHWLEILD